MTKKANICLIITAVLVIAAVVISCTGGISGKTEKGGCAVKINLGGSYASEDITAAMKNAGVNAAVCEVSRTNVEIELPAMSDEKLQKTADAILSGLTGNYPNASVVYADSFDAIGAKLNMLQIIYAVIGFAVLAFLYGWFRFGWKRSLVSVAASVATAADVWALSVILSSVVTIGMYLGAVIIGSMLLAYLYTLIVYAAKKNNENSCKLNVIACIAAIACVAVAACGGISVLKLMLPALIGSILAYGIVKYVAEPLWDCTAKKSI